MKTSTPEGVFVGTPFEVVEQLRELLSFHDVKTFEDYIKFCEDFFMRIFEKPLEIPKEGTPNQRAAILLNALHAAEIIEILEG